MDLVLANFQQPSDNEDDDYGSYFLQPASSPYNIAEKVQQANIDLFSSNIATNMEKTSRVTFKEQLASYEPELLSTDDDVNSIESEIQEAEFVQDNDQILLYKHSNVINLNIFDIIDEDEVVEEIVSEDDCDNNADALHETKIDKNVTLTISPIESVLPSSVKKKKKGRKKSSDNVLVECKNHCIERLDFDMSMSIKKLKIHEKPVKCPLLKLQRRKCCDENKSKNPSNLPCYNGLRSEYGLSSNELEKRKRRQEIIKLKEQKRQQLMQEYRSRKNQQNEAVFCQWLKEVAKRKAQKQKINTGINSAKQCFSPHVISLPTKVWEKAGERPKTANEFVPRQSIKKAKRRPHSTSACVFIEVQQRLLQSKF